MLRASAAERLLQRPGDQLLRLGLRDVLDDGHFGNQQVLGAVVHLLLAEREALLLLHFAEVLEDVGDVFETAGLHLLEVLAVAALPVGMGFLRGLFEKAQKAFDLRLFVQRAKADAIRVLDRHHQSRIIREKPEVVVRVIRTHDRRLADLLDDGHAVVRINELFPDLET